MRFLILAATLVVLVAVSASPVPQSKLQRGNEVADNQQYIEEVVVESLLQVRPPQGRQARTNTQTSLRDGARVAEDKNKGKSN